MPTTVLGLLGVLLCALAVTSQVTPQTDLDRFFTETAEESSIGEWSSLLVTEDVEKICIEVEPDIEKIVGTHFHVFIPILYRFQIGAEIKYLVKVYVGEHAYLHAMIFKALPWDEGGLSVVRVQHPKLFTDPLVPF